MHACMHACMYVYACIYRERELVYVCVYARMYVHIYAWCVYIYMHARVQFYLVIKGYVSWATRGPVVKFLGPNEE